MADKKYLAFKDEIDDINDVLTAHGTRYTEVVESSANVVSIPQMSAKRASVDEIRGSMRKCANLIDMSRFTDYTTGNLSIKYISSEDCILINGSNVSDDGAASTIATYISANIPAGIGNTYTLSYQYISGTIDGTCYIYISENDSISGSVSVAVNNPLLNHNNAISYTLKKPFVNAAGFYSSVAASFNNYKIRIMLNAGDTALPYEKYFKGLQNAQVSAIKSYDRTGKLIASTPIPESVLALDIGGEVGDYADSLDLKLQKYVKRIKKITFDGTEIWSLNTTFHCFTYNLPTKGDGYTIASNINMYCNYSNAYKTAVQIGSSSGPVERYGFSTADEWKSYLAARYAAGDPVMIEYALAEPEEGTLPEEINGAIEVSPEGRIEFATTSGNTEVPSTVTFDMISEGVDKPYLYNYVDRATSSKKYGVLWDMANSKCVSRLWDAADITLDTTNFGHFGAVNPNYNNPFDDIYPWSEMKLCNYDVRLMQEIVADGYDVRDAIIAWEGEPGFTLTPAIATVGVGRYSPEFWYISYDTDEGRVFGVSGTHQEGWLYAEPMIGGRWFGTDELVDGKHILGCRPGIPACNISMQNLHTYAKNADMTIDDIYSYDAISTLFVVEYANTNSQNAIGKGCDNLYAQGGYKIQTSAENTTIIQVLASQANNCIPNAIIDIGTTDGGMQIGKRYIISKTADETNPDLVNLKLNEAVTVTTDNYWAIHGIINTADAAIGSKSGYIGTNGKCNAYYRGQVFHSNMFRYVLGAYREKDTADIWVAKSRRRAEDFDALNKSAHINTGIALPSNAAAPTSGYIKKIAAVKGKLALPPFCAEIGGNNINPVGDYVYVPMLTTTNTVLLVGGHASGGTTGGRCCGDWYTAAGFAYWDLSALPVSKSPKRGA